MVEPFRNVTEFTLHTGTVHLQEVHTLKYNLIVERDVISGNKITVSIYMYLSICLPWHTFTGGGEGEGEGERDLSDIELSLGVLFRPSLLFLLGGEGSARD